MKKIGILTFHRAHNYGAVLQAFALCEYLNTNGYEAEIIDYYPNNIDQSKNTLLRRSYKTAMKIFRSVVKPTTQRRLCKFNKFSNIYKLSDKPFYGDVEIFECPPRYNVLISGSDQILNTVLTGKSCAYYLSFAYKCKKISYASSFGRENVSDLERQWVREYLSTFDALSVRESSAADIIEKEISIRPKLVVDPVFLLSQEKWGELINAQDNQTHSDNYIFVYAMEDTPQLRRGIEIARRQFPKQSATVVLGGNFSFPIDGKIDKTCGPVEFIDYIRNATCVVTNSFHGSAFSIIFGRPFVSVAHSSRGTRLENLARIAGYHQFLLNKDFDNDEENCIVDGKRAYSNIQPLIVESKEYLASAIGSAKGKNIEERLNMSKCCGCETCRQVCPANAIEMQVDKLGFRYPHVINETCIQCGICTDRCPILHINMNPSITNGYAVRHKSDSVVKNSTSGGVFTALSDYVLGEKGLVSGAILDDNFVCRHILTQDGAVRDKMRGTKYVQSEIGDCFSEIERALKGGKKVLFTGTPCQCAGLKNMLGEGNCKNLLTVDVVCHGVPSPKVFYDHIIWLSKQGGPILDYVFRSKEIGWHGWNVKVTYNNGRTELNTARVNSYCGMYFGSFITRKSCESCPYTSITRVGDITISDFWNISNCSNKFNDDIGTSCVYLNTEKGCEAFNRIKEFIVMETHSLQETIQQNLAKPTAANMNKDIFMKDYFRYGYGYCAEKYTRGHIYYSIRRLCGKVVNRIHRGDSSRK